MNIATIIITDEMGICMLNFFYNFILHLTERQSKADATYSKVGYTMDSNVLTFTSWRPLWMFPFKETEGWVCGEVLIILPLQGEGVFRVLHQSYHTNTCPVTPMAGVCFWSLHSINKIYLACGDFHSKMMLLWYISSAQSDTRRSYCCLMRCLSRIAFPKLFDPVMAHSVGVQLLVSSVMNMESYMRHPALIISSPMVLLRACIEC